VASYRELFAVREYRFLYSGQLLSYLGDQLGAVAIAALVFGRTGSGFLTAIAYAAAWLPGVLGGPVLATFADRLPRRRVMIACDVARAGLVALLALPGMPVGVAIALLYAAHLWSAPFVAARAAMLPEILSGEAYITGNGLANVTFQVCQVAGFAAGGIMVALTGPAVALLANAATFAVSAWLIAGGVRARPGPEPEPAERTGVWHDFRDGARYIVADRWLRGCLLLVWAASAFSFAVEGIAYPLAAQLGGGPRAAGLLLAASAAGFAPGAVVFTRLLSPRWRDRLLSPAAVFSVAILTPLVLAPSLAVAGGLLVAMGIGAAFSAPLNAIFVRRVAPAYRGRAMGVASSGLLAAQGIGFLVAGAAVDAGLAPTTVAGLSGAAGAVVVLAIAGYWRRARPADPAPDQAVRPGLRSGS
jgi:MFS family permease